MKETQTTFTCFNCERPENVIPLISLRFDGNHKWVCSQCMPTLIHHPQQVVNKLTEKKK